MASASNCLVEAVATATPSGPVPVAVLAASPAPAVSGLEAMHGALEAAGFVQKAAVAKAPRRARNADVEIRRESVLDYDLTATLAAEGFGAAAGAFTPRGLRWLYDEAFSDGTTVLAAFSGDRKVGHIALVHQTIAVEGRRERAVALVDLFILKAFRSRAAMTALYGAVEAFCLERAIRFIVAVPNGNAAGVNTRYLKLGQAARLEIRVGLGGLPTLGRRVESHRVAGLDAPRGREILSRYCAEAGTGLFWTGERLWARLQKPGAAYAIHAAEDLLLVSASRRDRRASHTMLCALLPRPGASPRRRDVAAVVSAACRLHRNPFFVYAGINASVPLPGLLLPARLRPSPMILQMRDFGAGAEPVTLSRFEALDFDFA